MKFKIKNINKKFKGGYIGENYYSATRHFHLHYPKNKNVIEIYSKLPKEVRKHTIKHEEIEAEEMKRGHRYKTAHKIALKYEASKIHLKKLMRIIK